MDFTPQEEEPKTKRARKTPCSCRLGGGGLDTKLLQSPSGGWARSDPIATLPHRSPSGATVSYIDYTATSLTGGKFPQWAFKELSKASI